jgi:competence protein ComEC
MPLITWLVGALLAGLLVGFTTAVKMFVAVALISGCTLGVAGRIRISAGCFVAAAGALSAMTARSTRVTCVQAAAGLRQATVTIVDDAGAGEFTRGQTRCGAPVTLFVANGHARGGARIDATGEFEPSVDSLSLTIRKAHIVEDRAPGWMARARTAALRAIDRDFGTDAPLVRALVVADMRAMPPDVRDRWAAAGMVHMLSVSGMHVAIIAAVIELLLGILHVDRKTTPAIALVVIVIYVAIIGAPPPAVRSAVMLGLRAGSRAMQRSVSPWAIVALGALHPAIDPWVVQDLGFQLSVIGVTALIVAGELLEKVPIPKRPKLLKEVASGLACTLVASLASMPLVAWSMGRVSLIAPVSNLAAGPFIALAQPVLFLGVLFAPAPAAARFVADAAHPLLGALDGIASVSARMPGASLTVWPSTTAAILIVLITASVLAACSRRGQLRTLGLGAIAMSVLAWLPAPRGSAFTELHMIDVGQGDAIALRTRQGRWVLFDAGRIWNGGDAGRRTVVPYIAHLGGRLEAFVLSHPHADHVGGAASVFDALHPLAYYDDAFVLPNEPYRASLEAARRDHVGWRRVHPGDSLMVDEATIRFLAPDSAFAASLPDPNNASTVAMIQIGDVKMLMMGDAEGPEEALLVQQLGDDLHAQILKVGHHGSSTSSTPPFLDAVKPVFALVSVGAGNTYGHPSAGIMADLARRGARVLRTDRLGTIILQTDGHVIHVKGE